MSDAGMADFCVWLNDVEEGVLRDDLSVALAETLGKLHEQAKALSCAKKGKLTLKLAFVVESNGAVHVGSDIETKVPKPPRQTDHFYVAREGGLTRRNPRQQEIRFKQVGGGREIKGKEQAAESRAEEGR